MIIINDEDKRISHYVLIVEHDDVGKLLDWALQEGFETFNVCRENGRWKLSHPLTKEERKEYAWLFHRMKVENDDPNPPKGGGPRGGGGGPTGGTPAAGETFKPENVEAVAA